MKNMTPEERNLWASDSQPKNLKITLTSPDESQTIELNNSDLLSESLELTQILESGKSLGFGDANSASLSVKAREISTDIRGWYLDATISLKDYPQYSVNLFKGIVDNQTNQNHEDFTCTITAHDYIKTINELDMTEWWRNLSIGKNKSFKTYIVSFITEVCSRTKMQSMSKANYAKLANTELIIAEKPDLISEYQTISGEMLLKWIAQATNVYFTMVGDKIKAVKLELMGEGLKPHIGLHPAQGLYPQAGVFNMAFPKGKYISAVYEPYKTEKIDKVVITDKGGIGEGQYPIEGEGDNPLYLDGNPFLWAMDMMQCAKTIYNRVHDVYFTPSTVKCSNTLFMELGDVIRVTTLKNEIHSYILNRRLCGINSIKDTYTNKSDQYQSAHNPSYADVTDLQSQSILKIKADIVEMNKIVANKIDAEYIKTAELNADNIKTGTLDCKNLTVKNLKVTNSMISEKIKAENIEVSNIKVTNDMISGTISTAHLDSRVITTKKLKTLELDASVIKSGKLSADYIEGGTLNCKNLSVSNLTFNNVGGQIGSGQISATIFSGQTIKCEKLYSTGGGIKLGGYDCAPSAVGVYCRSKNNDGTWRFYWDDNSHWVKT